ncbi:bifunctional aspartate kinase/homoserine dehydrogenase I [Montanilutibacter psychrotolerans]|uniref:Bifunctional aspartokinase/homoserine dehydrogenase n=1 Tax=Montanilutibacter psychrotolerans TaxID=1327343 RepID=A0A3M8SL48_9GAMM|nr:bifunctional aspartate kinase/homoserine dehydrogenase I [Lysobacter psychrotolerans]RNF81929.1 bifunctional aspartate kinase/homoserine dehydrogenase I [Lysobacter psychrotolerans]
MSAASSSNPPSSSSSSSPSSLSSSSADGPPNVVQREGATLDTPRRHAHKFGGSSLASAAHYRSAAGLLDDGASSRWVVVSAMQGVTDALLRLVADARAGRDWQADWGALQQRHIEAAALLDSGDALSSQLHDEFAALHGELAALAAPVDGAHDPGHALPGLGEVLSSRLMHAALGGDAAGWDRLDARDVLVTQPGELGCAIDWPATEALLAQWLERHRGTQVVVTGFVARDGQGRATVLGRNGSDWSAAIFARLFAAELLTIWTDVDGVLSADPRLVPDAVRLPSLSYAEACELAYFGAKVLHPQTLVPLQQRGVAVRIRNSARPDCPGTVIGPDGGAAARHDDGHPHPVKGLSLVENLAILDLSGSGMAGVPGTAERLFGALREAGVSVTMISQGSSEHSICCVVRADQAEPGRAAIARAFAEAIEAGQAQGVTVTPDICVLAAVGDGMVGTPGVAARLLGGLAQARVNVRAIAQGAGERNLSVAIAAGDATRALRSAHSAFWLSPQTISVGVIGPGQVGRALLAQLASSTFDGHDEGIDLRLRALADSRRMCLAAVRLDPADAIARLADAAAPGASVDDATTALDLDAFAAHVRAEHLPHALIVDCSGNDAIAAHYPRWLAAGIHVVTPSKHAGSGAWSRYQAIRTASAAVAGRGHAQFRYEATVGAGLPVIQTLRCLLDTGDVLLGIEGVLSGTLAWLFNRYDGSVPFSALVREAMALGYTEPDPRDDLSGTDVARKLVILAREAGCALSMDDVAIESLVPEALRGVSRSEFLERLHELDAPMQERLLQARASDRQLRHLARLELAAGEVHATVGVSSLDGGHAAVHTRLTDNLVQFRTRRYADNPLVVQGPGAGPDVTAAGVFGDILGIAQTLGAQA